MVPAVNRHITSPTSTSTPEAVANNPTGSSSDSKSKILSILADQQKQQSELMKTILALVGKNANGSADNPMDLTPGNPE